MGVTGREECKSASLTHYDGVDFAFNLKCRVVAAEDINHLLQLCFFYYQIMHMFLMLLKARHTASGLTVETENNHFDKIK